MIMGIMYGQLQGCFLFQNRNVQNKKKQLMAHSILYSQTQVFVFSFMYTIIE